MENSGIYTIEINNKFYVGSSRNLQNRWNVHTSTLHRNIHHNIYLQRAYNKYKTYKIEIIEYCNIEFLESQEKYWINMLDTLNQGYNILPNCNSMKGFKMLPQTRKALTKSIKGKKQNKEHINKRFKNIKKSILEFDLNNNFIKEWGSATEAGKNLNMCNSEIGKCCKGKITYVKNKIFKYKE